MATTRRLRRLAALVAIAASGSVAAFAAQRLSGLDPATFDRAVRAEDDLYRYVNGAWLDRTTIPEERVVYTAATELQERVELALRTIIEEIAAEPGKLPGSSAQQIGDLYTSMVDVDRLEALGRAPIEKELARLHGIASLRELAAAAGHLSATTTSGPFFSTPAVDGRTGAKVVHLSQGGTLLPDREYYLSAGAGYASVRREYQGYLSRIFALAGRSNVDADARAVLALETELARAQWTQTDTRDSVKTFNPYTLDELAREMPEFDWRAWARPQGFDRVASIVVMQPSFFRAFTALLPNTPLEVWKAWLAARYLTAMAPYLDAAFNAARFDFFGRSLTGQQSPRARWRRGVALVTDFLGDEIGRRYVERHFPPESRARVRVIAAHVIRAYRAAVRRSGWLSAPAKRAALDKLDALSVKIGYPDRWRRYRGLEIRSDDLAGNLARAQRFANAYRMSRVDDTRNRDDWLLPPQTVNAYYSLAENEIVFPAAILQRPYFNASADEAVNFGAIGAVIGHEIGHALDERGRMYDARGAARNWWTPADERAWASVTAGLVQQYSQYQPQPGMRLNGTLTLLENAGDVAGLAIAFEAYQGWLGGRQPPAIDGLTGPQRFFLGWARIWRSKERDEYERQLLLNSPYAPARYRANGPIGHVDAFHDAFGVQAGDRLHRPPADRVRIW